MSSETSAQETPRHLWIIGVLALLWNAFGALDYLMTQTRNETYMAQFTPEQVEYFHGFPSWVVAAWALAVWGGVLGCVLLLLRTRWAVPVFAVSLASMVVTTFHNFVLSNGIEAPKSTKASPPGTPPRKVASRKGFQSIRRKPAT